MRIARGNYTAKATNPCDDPSGRSGKTGSGIPGDGSSPSQRHAEHGG